MPGLKERFTARLLKAWYPSEPARKDWLSLALLDVSWLYRGLIAMRRSLYARGIFESERFAVPVVVVGNVIAGGAGKTPVVIELVRHLQSRGLRVGVVSRGYGREPGRNSRDVVEVTSDTRVQDSGDEPALIHRATAAPVFVATERIEAAFQLLAAHSETQVIVSDDGLQHLRLQRDIEIVVFDARGVGNGQLIPAGPLREAWPRAASDPRDAWPRASQPHIASFTLHTGSMDGHLLQRQLADYALLHDGSRLPLAQLREPLTAMAGIANPKAFFDALREQGLTLEQTHALPDHYAFDSIPGNPDERKPLICTEKDAVKLWQRFPEQRAHIFAVPLQIALPADFLAAFDSTLDQRLSSRHGRQTP
jgi:tetraacyldisaccharide 4'-kinase